MYCKNCGVQSPDDALFCKNCGAATNELTSKSLTSKQKPSIPTLVMIIADTIAVSVIAVFMIVFSSRLSAMENKIDALNISSTRSISEDKEKNTAASEKYHIEETSDDDSDDWIVADEKDEDYYEDDDYDYNDQIFDTGTDLTARDFLGTWSFYSGRTEKQVTFCSDGTFTGSVPYYYGQMQKQTQHSNKNDD